MHNALEDAGTLSTLLPENEDGEKAVTDPMTSAASERFIFRNETLEFNEAFCILNYFLEVELLDQVMSVISTTVCLIG